MIGTSIFLVQILGPLFYSPKDEISPSLGDRLRYLPFSLGLLGFFILHFGLFHLGHREILREFFPREQGESVAVLVLEFWPMLLSLALSQLHDFHIKYNVANFNSKEAKGLISAPISKPYISVFKMHLLIFVFAGLGSYQAQTSFTNHVIVLSVYFFPFRMFFPKVKPFDLQDV